MSLPLLFLWQSDLIDPVTQQRSNCISKRNMTANTAAHARVIEVARILALAIIYYLAAKLGLALAFVHDNVTTIWPPSGIALAAVLIFGWRMLPGVMLGAFLANLTTEISLTASAAIATGNTLEALLGMLLLRHLRGFDPGLQQVRDVLALILPGAMVSPLIAATVGTGALYLGDQAPSGELAQIWATWWAGDAMGILLVAPVILTWKYRRWTMDSIARRIEFILVLLAVAALGILAVPGDIIDASGHPYANLVFPPLLWAALRFGVWEAAIALITLSGFTIWQATHMSDTLFSSKGSMESVVTLHAFLIMLAVITLLLAARSREKKQAELALRDNNARLSMALQSANAGAWEWEVESNAVRWSRENFLLMGLDPDHTAASYENWLNSVYPDDRAETRARVAEAVQTRSNLDIEFRVQTPEGKERWINDIGRMVCDIRGNPVGMYGIQIDITRRKQAEEALFAEKERAQVTLASIGEAVITTDLQGNVEALNHVSEQITGWKTAEACGRSLEEILRIDNKISRQKRENPALQAIAENTVVTFSGDTILISRSGKVYTIEITAAPIHDRSGRTLGCVLVLRDVTEKRRLQDHIAWQAGHDTLTRLPNRALLIDRLEQARAHAQRHHQLLAVCFMDLDNFKAINDRHGHHYGDQLLVEIARRLLQTVRAGDTVARLGGDEFVLLLTDINHINDLEDMLGRVQKAVGAPYDMNGLRFSVTSSIGVTVYPLDDADSDTLLRRSDQAMYVSKQAGGSQFHLFDTGQDREAQSRRLQLDRIRHALAADEFRIYYQPKVNMRSGRIVGMEALIRWQHPEHGLLGPLEFLPLAEQTALIVDIGEWVIRQVLAQMSTWQRAGLELPVSVNIAARHLQIPGFAERLREMLQKQPDVPARFLELEVLETAALNDIEQARRVITACHGLGVRFALDDFGTGYSSLTYLRRLPADALKIDRSFVRDMLDDQEDLGIIEGVMSLARAFRRQVIAEGMEAPEQGVVLMRMGCDLAQGFGIARPMPASDVPAWVGAYRPDPQWGLWANTDWDMSDFPLLVAQYDHLRWISGILHAISDKTPQLPREELHDHHHCRFGMWYGNGGRARYGHLAEFAEIDPVHTQLHQLGPEIMRLRDNGEARRVPAHISELHSLKDQILERLAALQHAVARMA